MLADEYQDLNKAEQTAIAYLSEKAHICIVGDDDQSIYSFKHAHPEGIREWKNDSRGCADFEMAECQRCPTDVVEMANSLIDHNKQRDKRELKPIDAKGKGEVQIVQLVNSEIEAKWIAKKVKELLDKGVQPSEIIVLVQRKKGAPRNRQRVESRSVPASRTTRKASLRPKTRRCTSRVQAVLEQGRPRRTALPCRHRIARTSERIHMRKCARTVKDRRLRHSTRSKRCRQAP